MGNKRRAKSISELGEDALVERLGTLLPAEPRWVRIGRGVDDCAALDLGGGSWTLVTCDAQVEGTHFRRDWIDARTLGRRAAAVNLSDIAAMGGEPRAAVVSMVLPRRLEVAYYDAVMRGLGGRLAEFGAALVGGNLARAQRGISIEVTLMGRVRPERCVRRSGARVGDRILVTGDPGESGVALARLRRGLRRGGRLRKRFLDPEPRVHAGRLLAAGGVTAMIDVSDGVATDLSRLCTASAVGALVCHDSLPLSPALRRASTQLGKSAAEFALHGGEDYELLCTAPVARVARLRRRLLEAANLQLSDIGEIRPTGDGLRVEANGRTEPLEPRAFEHFDA